MSELIFLIIWIFLIFYFSYGWAAYSLKKLTNKNFRSSVTISLSLVVFVIRQTKN